MMNRFRKFQSRFALIIIKGSPAIAFLVGVVFVVIVLVDFKSDTTRITNAAFGITAILASLSFSCARASSDEDKDRDKFAYAGERFMHAAIFLIVGSILKYAMLAMQETGLAKAHTTSARVVLLPLSCIVAALFLNALFSAHTGLRVSGDALLPRLNRYDEYNRLL